MSYAPISRPEIQYLGEVASGAIYKKDPNNPEYPFFVGYDFQGNLTVGGQQATIGARTQTADRCLDMMVSQAMDEIDTVIFPSDRYRQLQVQTVRNHARLIVASSAISRKLGVSPAENFARVMGRAVSRVARDRLSEDFAAEFDDLELRERSDSPATLVAVDVHRFADIYGSAYTPLPPADALFAETGYSVSAVLDSIIDVVRTHPNGIS